jgi:hypothetical protein
VADIQWQKFDAYEMIAIISPGVLLLLGIARLYPGLSLAPSERDFSLGDFGVILLLAFVVGHLVHAFGNVGEWVWQLTGRWPTDLARSTTRFLPLLAPTQQDHLARQCQVRLGYPAGPLSSFTRDEWRGCVDRIKACVMSSRPPRLDTFNRTYGLFRGITFVCFCLAVLVVVRHGLTAWRLELAILFAAALAGYRMRHFGRLYATTLFCTFLELPAANVTEQEKSAAELGDEGGLGADVA